MVGASVSIPSLTRVELWGARAHPSPPVRQDVYTGLPWPPRSTDVFSDLCLLSDGLSRDAQMFVSVCVFRMGP